MYVTGRMWTPPAVQEGGVVTTSTLYYFVDTNLFIQCYALEELEWSPWHKFEKVPLIVSSPVLREIDPLSANLTETPAPL